MRAQKDGISRDFFFDFSFLAFVSGIIGARVFYVSEHAQYYLRYPAEIIMLQHGGMSWFGGLILGSLAGFIYLKKHNMPIYRVLDTLAPFLALAQAIGRIGCLLNGCCFGRVSKFGIYFPAHKATLIPTQLYSSLVLVFIFLVLRIIQEHPHKRGEIFFTYLVLYSLKRFFIEFWRADNGIIFFGLTLFQIMSLAIFLAAVFKLTLLIKSGD